LSTRTLVFNGVNAATGNYLLPPLPPDLISTIAQNEPLDERHLQELRYRLQRTGKVTLRLKAGVDPNKLEEAGWAVIFAHTAPHATREALKPLLEYRKNQAGKYDREYAGSLGYCTGESKLDFLARHGAGPGLADPDKVPYYLLIVGDPEAIPFQFQYHLDVQYAVGRIAFDSVEEYANYARSVVDAETRVLALEPTAVFFATQNPGDEATALSATELVEPLATHIASKLKPGTASWKTTIIAREKAFPRLLLTNNHVLDTARQPSAAMIELNDFEEIQLG
jgi:hypothetical protein